jgi:hypothetical protein
VGLHIVNTLLKIAGSVEAPNPLNCMIGSVGDAGLIRGMMDRLSTRLIIDHATIQTDDTSPPENNVGFSRLNRPMLASNQERSTYLTVRVLWLCELAVLGLTASTGSLNVG